jgi:hypothetical protein
MSSSPIVVVERESGEVYLFRRVAHAEGYLEPIDVENGEYDAFESDGAVLTLSVVTTSGQEQVEIVTHPDARPVPDTLRAKLRRYLDAMNEWRPEYEWMALPEIVGHLVGRFSR